MPLKKFIFAALFGFAIFTSPTAQSEPAAQAQIFSEKIRPIFNSRCIQCHSCYNSPCQLDLSSSEGLSRGLVNGFDVYDSRKLKAAEPSRLGIDRKTVAEWRSFSREHRFMPVVPEAGKPESSLLLQSVAHKAAHPNALIDDLADFKKQAAEKSRECPDTSRALSSFLQKRPSAGMPYGLPPLTSEELRLISEWTKQGAPHTPDTSEIPASDLSAVRRIETFLNRFTQNTGDQGKKQSLVSRYIYEHLFLAHLHLRSERTPASFYRLVRSRNACETGVDEVATRRPWNDPETKFFYCLKQVTTALVHKTHIPLLVDDKRLARWDSLFFSLPWSVSFKQPSGFASFFGAQKNSWEQDLAPRSDEQASNPLFVYRDIPVQARYQFLLDDAGYHVDTFIRGPVCKGNTAVNSIDEQFYVFFLRPESDLMARNQSFHKAAVPLHLLPAYRGSAQVGGITVGRKIREARNNYRVLRDEAYGKEFPQGYSLDDVWNGQGNADRFYSPTPNQNAALTVVRNYDSSAVQKGLIGATSKTAFLLDYSLLERLVYVLVTGFDVYGDASHQMHTRLYMSYLRMEAEENFLNLLPGTVREPMRKSWYVSAKGISEKIGNRVNAILLRDKDKMSRRFPLLGAERPTQVNLPALNLEKFYATDANQQEEILRGYRRTLVKRIKAHLGGALLNLPNLNPDKRLSERGGPKNIGNIESAAAFEAELAKLTDIKALSAPWVLKLPNLAYVVLETPTGPELYTLIRNKEHFNIAWVLGESGRRNRAADSLVAYKGILGSYPNHFFVIRLSQAQAFLRKMQSIQDHASYEAWIQEFGSPRSGPGSESFWAKSDRLHEVFRQKFPLEAGALDFNRYGMDYRYHDDEGEPDEFATELPPDLSEAFKDSSGDNE